LVTVPFAALKMISPVMAAGKLATSSLRVIGNSLRLQQ
jgi:cation transport ATPase